MTVMSKDKPPKADKAIEIIEKLKLDCAYVLDQERQNQTLPEVDRCMPEYELIDSEQIAQEIRAAIREENRCPITGNPCGTDTVKVKETEIIK